ncbi:photosystem II protein Psb27 [Cyanobacterium aponinum UTEX 3222]|uniref:Photosystem II lipoprotein Psb27 n=3 Tax=Cyanobacterium aponinum TaxID=379064 RepID=K9Z723_CYAAP|nr:photosystem II protein Psb27 [Cyanobacterium aponinum]AFZ54944.1 photosystem II protein Psb27 [Cyanobacterium aponinum PCC 10605]WPF88121.1 photosystem II protein Psb27 [Cyanobacterium aponinum AL20115]WRL40174.1 photosystem II protein Psb27 [Cyanobacterium aponinum UTEX 3221]WRL43068.1 photosystem II protein Psb27 [Cyanobacterium aponinum UTEX 3222]
MIKSYLRKIISLVLIVTIALFSFSQGAIALTGKYTDDTLTVIEDLTQVIETPADASIEVKRENQTLARKQINDYVSRYRKNNKYSGLKSFTTMQTALNSLAGYYTSYGNRPMPEKLKKRLLQEFKQVEFAIKKGY